MNLTITVMRTGRSNDSHWMVQINGYPIRTFHTREAALYYIELTITGFDN